MSLAIIVGSGPSARGFSPPDNAIVYGVNGTSTWLPRLDVWFTLDEQALKFARVPRKGTTYIAALPKEYHLPRHVIRMERVSAPRTADVGLGRWGCVKGMSKELGRIHTGNSVWGALQLAVHDGATRVLLVGVDADTAPKLEGGRSNDLSHLPELFESALPDVDLASAGRMQWAGPQLTIEEGLKWLMS